MSRLTGELVTGVTVVYSNHGFCTHSKALCGQLISLKTTQGLCRTRMSLSASRQTTCSYNTHLQCKAHKIQTDLPINSRRLRE